MEREYKILVALRTHFWNETAVFLARKLYGSTPSCDFIVLCDETNRTIDTVPFEKLSHTSDMSTLGLPAWPPGVNNLHFNGDYPLYVMREKYPDYDFYLMVEADAIINIDIERLLFHCCKEKIDVLGEVDEIDIHGTNLYHKSARKWFPITAKVFFPIVGLSGRFIDDLYKMRMAIINDGGSPEDWPYCEVFLGSMVVCSQVKRLQLSDFADIKKYCFMQHKYIHDVNVNKWGTICHPVTGKDFIERNLSVNDIAVVFDECSDLFTGLECLSPDFFYKKIEDRVKKKKNPELLLKFWNFSLEKGWISSLPPINYAFAMPATQSSVCFYSSSQDPAEDASLTVDGFITPYIKSHTDFEVRPWLKIDLCRDLEVRAIYIYISAEVYRRFVDFSIEFSEDKEKWQTVYLKNNGEELDCKDLKPIIVTFPKGNFTRYVKITQLNKDVMNINQVEVYGY